MTLRHLLRRLVFRRSGRRTRKDNNYAADAAERRIL